MAQVLVIGDDLTGSNATGALYARLGLRAVTVGALSQVERYVDRVDVLVVNTASRHWTPARAYAAVRAAAEAAGEAPLIVKRVDTTLRGNPGSELDAVVDVLAARSPSARNRTLAVPAFPDAGRSTVGGRHLVDGVPLTRTAVARDPFDPVRHSRVAAVLGAQSRRTTGELTLDVVERGPDAVAASLRASRAEVIVCDATENAHLRTVAVAAARLAEEDRIRWVALDSGPLGAALAGELGLRPEGGAPARIIRCLAEVARRAVTELSPGGLYASGGDAAAAVTSALGAEGFAIQTEVLPLAIAGHLVGGPHDGPLFATKGGLIGGPDAARDCLEHLRAACTRHALGATVSAT